MIILGVLLAVIIVFLTLVLISLGNYRPNEIDDLTVKENSNARIQQGQTLKIITWNLGYAGLGKESTFIYDALGKGMIFPTSREIVRKNLVGEIDTLKNGDANIALIQEITTNSIMNFNTKMYNDIRESLPLYNSVFSPSINLRFPFPLVHGNAVFSQYSAISTQRYALPFESSGFSRFLSQKFNFILQRYGIEDSQKQWVIINIHFSAFDKNGETRAKQMEYIKQGILNEYDKGNYIVVGGDWNMRLTDTDFPNDTQKKYLFWIQDIPERIKESLITKGFYFMFDSSTPSVRTDEKPYTGHNYTTITDGFLCSPNVEALKIHGVDGGFEYSDHNPVEIWVQGK
jgi:endonuclease/exonuclease/phosphatase family metal-dependent hydrolase